MNRHGLLNQKVGFLLLLVATLSFSAGCSSADNEASKGAPTGGFNNRGGSDNSADAGSQAPGDHNSDDDFVPEQEEDFEFSAPAVIGDRVYLANETLNSVAVIDSRNLSIATRLVGFRPTQVVGPNAERAEPAENARVMVLNEGSHSVSILASGADAGNEKAVPTVEVMARANRIAMEPTGRSAVVWYDPDQADAGDVAGDLSSVSVVQDGASYQVSVGFHVRAVAFDDAGTRALVLSDDGVSLIEFSELSDDAIAPPMPIVGAEYASTRPRDLEVLFTRDGKWALVRSATFRGAVLMEIDTGALHFMALPEIPTDIDLIEGDKLEVLLMLRQSGRAVRATIPDGFRAAADAIEAAQSFEGLPIEYHSMDLDDAGDAGPDAGDAGDVGDAGPDAGDVGPDAGDVGDAGDADGGLDAGNDAYDDDVSAPDSGTGDVSGADDAVSEAPVELPDNMEGFQVIELAVSGLGAAQVSSDGSQALLYTTLNEEKRAILYDLDPPQDASSQRVLLFEKGVRGALSDRAGETFLVFHTRVAGSIPAGVTPADPEYIAHSWGVSVVDVDSAATRLVLSQHEPGQAVLYTPDSSDDSGALEDAKIYMIFKTPAGATNVDPSRRDVLTINLRSFRTDSFRVPSVPEGLGLIPDAGRIYISQRHPQGRMTFVDVVSGARQTITGYQLNAGID